MQKATQVNQEYTLLPVPTEVMEEVGIDAFSSLTAVILQTIHGRFHEKEDYRYVNDHHKSLGHVSHVPYQTCTGNGTYKDQHSGQDAKEDKTDLGRFPVQDKGQAAFAVRVVANQCGKGK